MEIARRRSKPFSGFMGIIVAILLVVAAFSGNVHARNCTPDEKEQADRLLWLNKRDTAKAIEFHLPWGVPESS